MGHIYLPLVNQGLQIPPGNEDVIKLFFSFFNYKIADEDRSGGNINTVTPISYNTLPPVT